MFRKTSISLDRLREAPHYDAETGVFIWAIKASKNTIIGERAGRLHKTRGYIEISVDKELFYAHRLAWFFVFGKWPEHDIDHINGVKSDNRIANLREATRAQNNQNQAAKRKSSSGLLGVSWSKTAKKWVAQIKLKGRQHRLGNFHTKEEAHEAYLKAKKILHTFSPVPR